MRPTIINDSGMEISEEALEKWVKGITNELVRKKVLTTEKKDKEIGLVFLSENDAKKLNWNYRCKDYPTDILSFDSEDPASLGELVLCPQVILRQAKDHGITQEEEFGYIILHGVLHLLGYDHEKSKENEALMMSLQDEVFDNLRNPKKVSTPKAAVTLATEIKLKKSMPKETIKETSKNAAVAKDSKAAKDSKLVTKPSVVGKVITKSAKSSSASNLETKKTSKVKSKTSKEKVVLAKTKNKKKR